MLWILIAIVVGVFSATLVTAGVFRVHDEWAWMRPKKACIRCELPRTGLDFVPIVGDIVTGARCRKCKTFVPWQYPMIEIIIIALVVFHFWRYINGIWIPDAALGTNILWLWIARDVIFAIFLLIVFIYDLKFSLILDTYSVPATIVALFLNFALGLDLWSMLSGMAILFVFFLLQYALSGGRILGAGDIRMGLVMGAMLGFGGGIAALFLAYVIGAIVGSALLLSGRHSMKDRVPFGTFLSVAVFVMLVWGPKLLGLLI